MQAANARQDDSLTDEEIVDRILQGERRLFATLMRRSNRRIYRAARAIVRTDDEAEDVMQEAYVRAYHHLNQFAGRSSWMTWITRIAMHEAWARVRRSGREVEEDSTMPEDQGAFASMMSAAADPEARTFGRELLQLVEKSLDSMPEAFRTAFVLREVEGLSTQEVAACLDVPEETVKTRLHRARQRMRSALVEQVSPAVPEAYSFHLSRCDRVVDAVMRRIR